MKRCFSDVETYSTQPSEELLVGIQKSINQTFSKIDKAVKRGVLHRNNGANQKSRLSNAFKNAIGSKEGK